MRAGRSRPVAAAALAATFLAGAVAGAAGYRFLAPERDGGPPAAPAEPEGGRTGEAGEKGRHGRDGGPTSAMLEILREEVGISDRQERRVRSVLERREERAHEVFEGVRERFRRWMDTTVARVKAVLDEDQAAEFERLLQERLEKRRREHRQREEPDSTGGPPSSGNGS